MAGKQKDEKKRLGTGSVQPLDKILSSWIESHFRGESPQSITVYPLEKGRHRQLRLRLFVIKANEQVGAERSVEIANELYSECQVHCDALPSSELYKSRKSYQLSMIDDRRGGLAEPVGSYVLTLAQRAMRPGMTEEGEEEEGEEEVTALTMMERVFNGIAERDERGNEGMAKQFGEVLLYLKESVKERETSYVKMVEANLDILQKYAATLERLAERHVEERAVGIDEANAAENRRDQASRRDKEGMWTDVTKAGMLEAVKVLGELFPGFGKLALAQLSGQPMPPSPQLGGTSPAAPAGTPQLPAVPEEKLIIDRFIDTAEKHRIDEAHTAAERLFGKDDDKTGAIEEPGVFTREQVAILSGVHTGSIGVESLDALLMDSGKPEAVTMMQMAKAMAYLTPQMVTDIKQFMKLRMDKRGKSN